MKILLIILGLLYTGSLGAAQIIAEDPVYGKVDEGKKIYNSTCIRCHNTNPHQPGVIGPDLFSTPKEVFKSKVPYGTYPEGYTPKRKTRVMPKFKNLEDKTDLIYEYIKNFQ